MICSLISSKRPLLPFWNSISWSGMLMCLGMIQWFWNPAEDTGYFFSIKRSFQGRRMFTRREYVSFYVLISKKHLSKISWIIWAQEPRQPFECIDYSVWPIFSTCNKTKQFISSLKASKFNIATNTHCEEGEARRKATFLPALEQESFIPFVPLGNPAAVKAPKRFGVDLCFQHVEKKSIAYSPF